MLGGIALGSVQGFAAVNAQSDVQVRFNPYTGGGEDPGNLALAYVPAGIDFGNNNLSAPGTPVFYNGTTNGADYVAVDDDRASGGDWKLVASASVLQSTTTSQTISSGNITLTSTSNVLDYDVNIGTPADPASLGSVSTGVTQSASATLPLGGGSQTIATSTNTVNQGYAIPIDTVRLNMTSSNSHGGQTFAGKITWELSDTI
ncbi:WxL domain-containing protein [Enterococcus pallens]|nr:WxL domain-containing protein [Enterococcus pallens]